MKLAVRICHAEGTKIPNQELAARIENVHMLELAFQACLPGLLMLSGSDLSGTIPQEKKQQEPAVWQIDHIPATRQGISAGTALYAEGEGSKGSKGTPCSLAKLLQIRQSTRIALGIITEIPNMNNPALLGVIAQLPEGAYLMFLGNMSSQNTAAQPTFPLWKQATAKQDMLSGSVCSSPAISLPPYGWKIFKLYAD
jgi:hypothetical protein